MASVTAGPPWWRKVDGASWHQPEGPGSTLEGRGDHPDVLAMNIWPRRFTDHNAAEDGHIGTAPVDAFAPDGFGLFNVTGNVREWVFDRFGPRDGVQPRPDAPAVTAGSGGRRVQRGGPYLCHDICCDRDHVDSLRSNDADSATGNCGFRIAV